jgi:hypothetical protein
MKPPIVATIGGGSPLPDRERGSLPGNAEATDACEYVSVAGALQSVAQSARPGLERLPCIEASAAAAPHYC